MVKASVYNAEDPGSIPGSGRSPGKGNGTPLLPGKPHGQRSLVGYSPWDHKESDTTEQLHLDDLNSRTTEQLLQVSLPNPSLSQSI